MPTKTTGIRQAKTTRPRSLNRKSNNQNQLKGADTATPSATINGKATAADHLTKANDAMMRAWELISQRKDRQD